MNGGPSFGEPRHRHHESPPQREREKRTEALRPIDTVSSSNEEEEEDSFEDEQADYQSSYIMARGLKDGQSAGGRDSSDRREKHLKPSESLSQIEHDRELSIRKAASKVNSATDSKVYSQREDVKKRNPSPHPIKATKTMKTLDHESKKIPSLNLKHKALKSRYSSNSHSRKASSDDSEKNAGAKENSKPSSKSQRPRSKSASKKKAASKQQTSFSQVSEPKQRKPCS